MARVVALTAPRTLAIEDHADPPLGAHEVRLETLLSGISAGTELASFRGTNPYLHKRWDAAQRLFRDDGAPSLAYPVRSLGYEEVGRVVDRGAAVATPPWATSCTAPGATARTTWPNPPGRRRGACRTASTRASASSRTSARSR